MSDDPSRPSDSVKRTSTGAPEVLLAIGAVLVAALLAEILLRIHYLTTDTGTLADLALELALDDSGRGASPHRSTLLGIPDVHDQGAGLVAVG